MRDLLVTVHTPALSTGRAMRTYTLARALAAGSDGLDLLYARFGAAIPDRAFCAISGIELHEVRPRRNLRRLLTYARMRARRVPPSLARGISPELIAAATDLADAPARGRIIADGPIAAGALRRLAGRRAVIYNAHNLESAFRTEFGGRRARGLRAYDRGLLRRASESWMVSQADAAGALKLCPGAQIRYVPNVVDVGRVLPVTVPANVRCALMVADFSYGPNRTGLRFLLEQVMPRVWSDLPDARLALAGRGLTGAPADPRVERLGFVEDLAAAYAGASCAVVPLLQSGGTPVKFIEAMAYGLPVVATPRAAAGLMARNEQHYRAGASGAEFAANVIALMRDGDGGLGLRGRAFVERHYSIDTLTRLLAP